MRYVTFINIILIVTCSKTLKYTQGTHKAATYYNITILFKTAYKGILSITEDFLMRNRIEITDSRELTAS